MSARENYTGAHVRSLSPLHYADRGEPAQFKIPAGSILLPDSAPFEARKFFQPLLDVLALAAAVIFALCAGGSIIVFFIMLFLMEIR